jgi:putative transposase
MDSGNYINIRHRVGENKQHLEWCPKYRYEAMRSPYIAEEMKGLLEEIAMEKGMIVHKIVVDCNHVHMLVSLPTWMSVSSALQYLKGISSYKIFRLHPTFRKRYRKGAFWSPGHFSRSVSNVTESAVEHYIDKHEYPKFLPQEVGRQMPLRFN